MGRGEGAARAVAHVLKVVMREVRKEDKAAARRRAVPRYRKQNRRPEEAASVSPHIREVTSSWRLLHPARHP